MRVNKDIIAVVALLLVFLVGGLLLGGHDDTRSRQAGKEMLADPSIYNDRASGSHALFDWVKAQGYQSEAWRQDWTRLDQSHASVLLVLDPQASESYRLLTPTASGSGDDSDKTILTASDWPTLKHWLQAGHTVVLMSSRLPTGHTAGMSGGTDTFADAADLIVETASGSQRREYAPAQPTALTQGVMSIYSDSDARIKRNAPDAIALFADHAGPNVLEIPVGNGRLIAIADARFASNGNLARSENAVFLSHVLARAGAPGSRVLFDEYHHGDVEAIAGASLWSVLGHPMQLALTQLLIASFVLVGVLAVRFGNAVPLLQGAERTSAEYVTSVAGLYRRAHASGAALETLYRQFLRDVCARLALDPTIDLERLAEAVARRGNTDRERLRHLLAACEAHLDQGKISEYELLDLVRQMERVRKDIGIV